MLYSLHKIINQSNCPFSEKDYSLFKFGNISCAKRFANELFSGFIEEHFDLILAQNEIIVLSSPYYSIPTASNYLCHFFKENLNRFLFKNGRGACKESKIHRNQTYLDDYGNMDYNQRISLIANDTYYIDRHYIDGKFCIFLDDIKITGSHEFTINKILDHYHVKGEFLFVYYAELINKDIHPNIENHYNYFAIQSLHDITNIINGDSFQFNTRLVKYLLQLNDMDFNTLVNNISSEKTNELMSLAVSNNYHLIDLLKNNIIKLEQLWQSTYKRDKERVLDLQSSQLA